MGDFGPTRSSQVTLHGSFRSLYLVQIAFLHSNKVFLSQWNFCWSLSNVLTIFGFCINTDFLLPFLSVSYADFLLLTLGERHETALVLTMMMVVEVGGGVP